MAGFDGHSNRIGDAGRQRTTHVVAGLRFVPALADGSDGRRIAAHGDKSVALAALSPRRSLVRRRSVRPSSARLDLGRMGGGSNAFRRGPTVNWHPSLRSPACSPGTARFRAVFDRDESEGDFHGG